MQSAEQPKISFYGVSIVHVNLNVLRPMEEGEHKIDLNVDAKLVPLEEGSREFRIWMEADLKMPEYWDIKVTGFGDFELGDDVPVSEVRSLVNVNAPAIMFPYFRAFVSNLAANCGGSVPFIILPPRLFDGELEEMKVEEAE
jgi:preprotein translocase subunit SecB